MTSLLGRIASVLTVALLIEVGCGLSVVGVGAGEGEASDGGGASSGNSGSSGSSGVDGAVPADSGFYTADGGRACSAWKARHFDPCTIPAPGAAIAVPATGTLVYDTDIPGFAGGPPASPPWTMVDQGGTPAVVISVESFVVPSGGTLRVIGAKPLIVAAWSSITISGTIDVGSHLTDNRAGAGSNPALCSATAAMAGVDERDTGGGSGGGGGGSFAGAGGGGGPGDTAKQNAGGAGGKSVAAPTLVRGGCSGAASGKAGLDAAVQSPSNKDTTAPGGAGGGAIELSAKTTIAVTGTGRILAGGAGGGGAPLNSAVGGGGGGSGGYVGFDAPAYDFSSGAQVAANGGGGGASNGFVNVGAPGSDGAASTTPANGGAAGTCAAQGAPGGAGGTLDGALASQDEQACGGAGGGGGAGYVLVFAPSFTPPTGVLFSPAPTIK